MSKSLSSSPNGLSEVGSTTTVVSVDLSSISTSATVLAVSPSNSPISMSSKSNSRFSSTPDSSVKLGVVVTVAVAPHASPTKSSSASWTTDSLGIKAPSSSSFCAKSDASSNTGSSNCSTSFVDDEFKMIFSPI